MLALVVGVVALTRWRPGRTWSLLLAGLVALVFADIAYTPGDGDGGLPTAPTGSTPFYMHRRGLPSALEAWQPRRGADPAAPAASTSGAS